MGAMNAWGHLVVVGAGDDTNELWDFAEELRDRLGERIGGHAPGLHGFTRRERHEMPAAKRFCYHPTGEPHIEFRSDDLHEAILAGAAYLAKLLPEDELWRRD